MVRALAAVLLLLSGCKLVDQTTFAPAPEAPAPVAAPAPEQLPLVVIPAGTPPADYRDLLAYAVAQAQARKPEVAFDVTALLTGHGDPITARAEARAGGAEAEAVMRTMRAIGVPPGRIHLGAVVDGAASGRAVRVYVR